MAAAQQDFPDHPVATGKYRERMYPSFAVMIHGLVDNGKGKVKYNMEFLNAETDLPLKKKGKLDGNIEVYHAGTSFCMEIKDKDDKMRFKYRLMGFPSPITAKPTAKWSDGKYIDIQIKKDEAPKWPDNPRAGPKTRLTDFNDV